MLSLPQNTNWADNVKALVKKKIGLMDNSVIYLFYRI